MHTDQTKNTRVNDNSKSVEQKEKHEAINPFDHHRETSEDKQQVADDLQNEQAYKEAQTERD